jgi:hypothetical protein
VRLAGVAQSWSTISLALPHGTWPNGRQPLKAPSCPCRHEVLFIGDDDFGALSKLEEVLARKGKLSGIDF